MWNTEVWDLDGILPSYREVPGLRQQVINAHASIAKFMDDNGLFRKKRRVFDAKGKLLVRSVFVNDLTSEGLRFVKVAADSWFGSKASNEYPANTQLLEKHLKSVRKRGAPIVGTRPPKIAKAPPPKYDPWDLDARLRRTKNGVMRTLAERHYTTALAFLRDNGLLKTKRVFDARGNPVLRHVTPQHLTPRGALFAQAAGERWFGSKRAFMHPENVSMLRKILEEVG
jgi:hypothetical protein